MLTVNLMTEIYIKEGVREVFDKRVIACDRCRQGR